MKPLLALALFAMACTPDTAQQAHPRLASNALPVTVLVPQDRDFLEKAAEGSNAEIEMGKLVENRALSEEVKAYGRRMVADHSAINARLAAIAARHGISLPTTLGEHQASFDRVVDLRREQFDQEFMQVMNEDHDMARELFRSEASGGFDPELKAFAATTLPLIDAHLTHAKSMAHGIKPTP
jgi:putative membrane protein